MITTHYSQDDFKTGKQAISKEQLVERILSAPHNSFASYETKKGTIDNFKRSIWKEGELKGKEIDTFTFRYGRQEIMLQPYDEATNGDKETFIEECKEYIKKVKKCHQQLKRIVSGLGKNPCCFSRGLPEVTLGEFLNEMDQNTQ